MCNVCYYYVSSPTGSNLNKYNIYLPGTWYPVVNKYKNNDHENKSLMLKNYIATTTGTMLVSNLP